MESMFGIEAYWQWVAIACILLAVEVLIVPTGFFLCLGTSAGIMALLTYLVPSLPFLWMLTIYAVLMVISCLFWMRVLRRRPKEADSDRLGQRSMQMVGKHLVLEEAIKAGKGRVKINDSPWPVEADADYPAGTKVEVTGVSGITLTIRSINN